MVRTAQGPICELQPAAGAHGAPDRIRRARQLETDPAELQRMPALPVDSSGAVDETALHERRERLDRRTVPRRLHGNQGAERKRDDDGPYMCVAPGYARARRSAAGLLLRLISDDDAEPASRLRRLLHGLAGVGHRVARGLRMGGG